MPGFLHPKSVSIFAFIDVGSSLSLAPEEPKRASESFPIKTSLIFCEWILVRVQRLLRMNFFMVFFPASVLAGGKSFKLEKAITP